MYQSDILLKDKMLKILVTYFTFVLFANGSTAQDCTKPPSVANPDKCCSFDTTPNDEIDKKCAQLVKTEAPPPGVSSDVCLAECYFNSTQILTNGKLDMAKLKASLQKDKTIAPDSLPVMEKIFQACEGKVNSFVGKLPPTKGQEPSRCKPYSGALFLCIGSEAIINCPANKWQSSQECNNLRDYLKACPLIK